MRRMQKMKKMNFKGKRLGPGFGRLRKNKSAGRVSFAWWNK